MADMFLTDRKLERRISELQSYRYRDVISLKEFCVREDTQGVVNPVLPTSFKGWDTIRIGDTWKGRDRYLWLYSEFTVPADWKGRKVVGVFDYGKTGDGSNSGFESMLYLNGQMYQGVDSNHKEVFLSEELCGSRVTALFRLWSGLEGGGVPREMEHRISQADLAWLDEKVDDFYYTARVALETIQGMDEFNPVRCDLRKTLEGACRMIDWSYPGSEAFYETVHEADDYLNKKLDAMDKDSLINVYCVGHTHIDVAWLWRLKHTAEKCSRSFSTVFRMMELYPEYIFLQTQPQLYEYMKENFPDIFEKIKEKVQEGRWEVDGAMWVEADCNLTSGESLTRQILLGSRFIQEEFGKDIHYLWLPDVFGYSWALPQILKKAGIDTFMTTKISWNQYNRMPHDTFIWKGIDGSEVLTHFITTPEPWNEPGSWFYTYNGKLLPQTVKGVWDAYSEKNINKDLLIAYGYGDGGGGVNRDMLENRRRIDKMPGLPHLKTSTAKEYFEKLHETFENTDEYVHTWDGELYLEYHRGTYTSHAHNKLMNRKMELLYRKVEWLTVMEALAKGDLAAAKQEELTKGWKHILTDQFHDIIPGSSIFEVYEDSRKDYEYIEEVARQVENSFYDLALEEKENTWTVWNDSSWTRNELVAVPRAEDGIYKDEQGNVLMAQKADDATWIYLQDVPAMGSKVICLEKAEDNHQAAGLTEAFTIRGREIETPYYRIVLNEAGQISNLYDKTYEREVLAPGTCANVLQMFEDKPIDNDAWDIDIFYQEKMREITDLITCEVKECGALRMVLHMEWRYMNTIISQDIILYRYSRRIDFATKVDYHETHQLLKAAFPVDIRSTYATYDVQYGNVRRPNHWNTSWDQARFESVAHRWVDFSERGYGVSLLNDCKYGHDVKDNVIRITLIKAATHPDHLQDQGEHVFTYSLLPHGGDFVDGKVVQEAFALNDPMQAVSGKLTDTCTSFLQIDQEQVELDAVKKSEDGQAIVIRFHEFAGSRQKVVLRPGFAYKAWAEGDLRERQIGEIMDSQEICMNVKPFEIKTILIYL